MSKLELYNRLRARMEKTRGAGFMDAFVKPSPVASRIAAALKNPVLQQALLKAVVGGAGPIGGGPVGGYIIGGRRAKKPASKAQKAAAKSSKWLAHVAKIRAELKKRGIEMSQPEILKLASQSYR